MEKLMVTSNSLKRMDRLINLTLRVKRIHRSRLMSTTINGLSITDNKNSTNSLIQLRYQHLVTITAFINSSSQKTTNSLQRLTQPPKPSSWQVSPSPLGSDPTSTGKEGSDLFSYLITPSLLNNSYYLN
jgi:hypothetical protein